MRKTSDTGDDILGLSKSFEKKVVAKLENIVDIEMVPEENHAEFLHSLLFEDVLFLTNCVINDQANWRC